MEDVTLETLIESINLLIERYEEAHHCRLWVDDGNFYPHLTTLLKNQVREAKLLKTKEER